MSAHQQGSLIDGLEDVGAPKNSEASSGGGIGSLVKQPWFKGTVAGLALLIGVVSILAAVRSGEGDIAAETFRRPLICIESGEVFEERRVASGDTMPFENPKTGKRTLFRAERCFWLNENEAKLTPTYVLLNEFAGVDGPTYCPDCGKPVVMHNPMPPDHLLDAAVVREHGEDALKRVPATNGG